jgi:fructose-bisphosphate aldolase class I
MTVNPEQLERMRSGKGFIAALDQSGGSTPKALSLYGIGESEYSGEAQMFDLMHAMRTRMIKSRAFSGDRVLGAILFEGTMDREIDGLGSADYLWSKKRVVPFLKVDKGLADESDGVQTMKPMPDLAALLERAVGKGVFGTKMRSVIKLANRAGIDAVVRQQFEVGRQIIGHGLVPIIEPEVDIKSSQKREAEEMLRASILAELANQPTSQPVMLKLTIPSVANFYAELIKHPSVVRVVALSGGYPRDEANRLLSENHGMIASFSRALSEGLSAKQSEADFDAVLDATIAGIYAASIT